jgi:hypothetical protein
MAQLRQDYQKFVELNTEVIVIGPEDSKTFAALVARTSNIVYWHT